jgi:hypothetical protein
MKKEHIDGPATQAAIGESARDVLCPAFLMAHSAVPPRIDNIESVALVSGLQNHYHSP